MATLSAQDLETLRVELAGSAYAGLSDFQRFHLFHAPGTQANPATAPQIPAPLSVSAMMGAISLESRNKVYNRPAVVAFKSDVENQNRAASANWIALAYGAGDLTGPEYAVLMGQIAATIADPDHPATLPTSSRKQVLFGSKSWTRSDGSTIDFVPLADIAEAR